MSRKRIGWILGIVVTIAVASFLVPAAADWLVTKDGARMETDGPWKVDNRLVVFKRPDGTYASVRVSDVDLEASERLTEEMAEKDRSPKPVREKQEPAPPKKAVIRLTDKDLPPVGRRDEAARPTSQEGAPPAEGAAAPPPNGATGERQPLEVVTWRESETSESGGVEFVGRVRNRSERTALGVTVTVTLFDPEGEELATTRATITSLSLPPGATAGFRASFPSVFTYARAEFGVTGDLVLNEP